MGGRVFDFSNDFRGYEQNEVEYFLLFKETELPSISDLLLTRGNSGLKFTPDLGRAKFGCTCGEYLGGFLSPRTCHALQVNAELQFDLIGLCRNTPEDSLFEVSCAELFPVSTDNYKALETDEYLCRGFLELFKSITVCLEMKVLPATAKIRGMLNIETIESGSKAAAKNFIRKVETVSSSLQGLFGVVLS